VADPVPPIAVDTNVVIAALVTDHPHHQPSAALLELTDRANLCIPVHCLTETYAVLTRPPFRWLAVEAWAGVRTIADASKSIGLSSAQSIEAIRLFAEMRGSGAKLYDFLIGRAALVSGLDTIVTWSTAHFRSLFPGLTILTPTEFIARCGGVPADHG
jgi:predicted nucleic acid-binding protein